MLKETDFQNMWNINTPFQKFFFTFKIHMSLLGDKIFNFMPSFLIHSVIYAWHIVVKEKIYTKC